MQEILQKQRVILDIDDIRALVHNDVTMVDQLILKRLSSEVALINELGRYIVNSGGKRRRPLLVLLAARDCGYQGEHLQELAAVIALIPTGTLLHAVVGGAPAPRRAAPTTPAIRVNDSA